MKLYTEEQVRKEQEDFWQGIKDWFDKQETLEGDLIKEMDKMLIKKIGNKPQSITDETLSKQQDNGN